MHRSSGAHTYHTAPQDIGQLGFKFQFVTLAGFHAVNNSMFELAKGFAATGMGAYSELQQREFANEKLGYTATKHQREVGLWPGTCMCGVLKPLCDMSCCGAFVAICTRAATCVRGRRLWLCCYVWRSGCSCQQLCVSVHLGCTTCCLSCPLSVKLPVVLGMAPI